MFKEAKTKVLVAAHSDNDIRAKLTEKFDHQCDFLFLDKDATATKEQFETAEIIIGEPSEESIVLANNLKWLQLTWAGADKYVRMKGLPSGVIITNASGAFGIIISEYVIGSIISLYRSFPSYWNNQQKHVWKKLSYTDTIFGKNVLILGTGDIGTSIAYRLKSFGTHTVGVKRRFTDKSLEGFDEVYDFTKLDKVLPNADIVIGCLPHTTKTAGMLNYDRLRAMKKDAVLVNVGRGSLINDDDLIEILKSGHLKGAVLDVFDTEPLKNDSSLWDMDNVIITPHIAGPSFGGNTDVKNAIWDICIENINRYLEGKTLKNIVSIENEY